MKYVTSGVVGQLGPNVLRLVDLVLQETELVTVRITHAQAKTLLQETATLLLAKKVRPLVFIYL